MVVCGPPIIALLHTPEIDENDYWKDVSFWLGLTTSRDLVLAIWVCRALLSAQQFAQGYLWSFLPEAIYEAASLDMFKKSPNLASLPPIIQNILLLDYNSNRSCRNVPLLVSYLFCCLASL